MSQSIGRREFTAALPVALAAAWVGIGPAKGAAQGASALTPAGYSEGWSVQAWTPG